MTRCFDVFMDDNGRVWADMGGLELVEYVPQGKAEGLRSALEWIASEGDDQQSASVMRRMARQALGA